MFYVRHHMCLFASFHYEKQREGARKGEREGHRRDAAPSSNCIANTKVVVRRSRYMRCSLIRFGHSNTKNRPERARMYTIRKPVGDVMRVYRQPFLTPNMADALPTLAPNCAWAVVLQYGTFTSLILLLNWFTSSNITCTSSARRPSRLRTVVSTRFALFARLSYFLSHLSLVALDRRAEGGDRHELYVSRNRISVIFCRITLFIFVSKYVHFIILHMCILFYFIVSFEWTF